MKRPQDELNGQEGGTSIAFCKRYRRTPTVLDCTVVPEPDIMSSQVPCYVPGFLSSLATRARVLTIASPLTAHTAKIGHSSTEEENTGARMDRKIWISIKRCEESRRRIENTFRMNQRIPAPSSKRTHSPHQRRIQHRRHQRTLSRNFSPRLSMRRN